jgi:hypothetical protein
MKTNKYNKVLVGVIYLFLLSFSPLLLTSCEGGDLYGIDSPDWIGAKVDSIAESKKKSSGDDPVIEGLHEDVYTIGKEDFSSGFWTLGKTYVVSAGQKWQAQFNLTVNADNVYYKNCYIVFNDYNPDTDDHLGTEYGVIRFDNDPTKNSEWGGDIDRSLVKANFENSSNNDAETDPSVQKMNGKVTITVDRTEGGVHYTIANGELTKEYIQPYDFPMNNAEGKICCRIGIEKSIVNFLGSTIEPIGGYTSKEDKQPLSMTLNGVPKKVLQGVTFEEAFASVTATVQFEQGVSKEIPFAELTFEVIPDMNDLGQKNLVAAYAKSFKGEAAKPVIGYAQFEIVDKMYKTLGATDNSTGWWGAHSDNIKVNPGETFVSRFTNYTSGQNNWNNFVVVLCKADNSEYAVVRADNYGWGAGYDNNPNLSTSGGQSDWGAWLAAMDGAKVTTYVTNFGDGNANVVAVMEGNDGITYIQEYRGIAIDDPDNFYFRFTVDNCHLEYDDVVGADDNSTAFWGAHSADFEVPLGQTVTTRIRNYTSGQSNWNNFVVVLTSDGTTEYAVVRADNYGWGDSYGSCTTSGGQSDWAAWLAAMDDAVVTVSVTNNGDSADVRCYMEGNDGNTYYQDYLGISPTDGRLYFRFTVDGSHLVFE